MLDFSLKKVPKRHRFSAWVIEAAIRKYHMFPLSLRHVSKLFLERNIILSYETIRQWNKKFSEKIRKQLKRRIRSTTWYIGEAYVKVNGDFWFAYRAVDQDGYTLDVMLQKNRSKSSAIRFFKRILGNLPLLMLLLQTGFLVIKNPSRNYFLILNIFEVNGLIIGWRMPINRCEKKKKSCKNLSVLKELKG